MIGRSTSYTDVHERLHGSQVHRVCSKVAGGFHCNSGKLPSQKLSVLICKMGLECLLQCMVVRNRDLYEASL
jgi:hypothetical protein